MIPCIAGYGIKKLFNIVTIKCQVRRNKLSYGHGGKLNILHKSRIAHNMSCIDMRDEGGLIWTSRIVVFFVV